MIGAEEFARNPESDICSKILVIDDDHDYNESICESLEMDGYQTASAFSAKTAKKVIKEFDADVALIDINLGKDNGIELISKIRRIRPNVLCVIITGNADMDSAIQAVKEGAYDYLRKPTSMEDILATLARCWDLQKLEREKLAAVTALRNRNRDLEAINGRLRTMVDTTRKIVACTGLEEMAPQILEEFARNMGAEGGSMYLAEEGGLRLAHTLDPGHAPDWIEFPLRKDSIIQQAVKSGEPVLVQNIASSTNLSESGWTGYRDSSLLVMPLPGASGSMLGIVTFHNKTYPPFTKQDREIGAILGSFSHEAIRAARAAEELQATLEKQTEQLEELVNERTSELLDAKDIAEKANNEKNRFLSSMSHELRTPLNAIIGFADILRQGMAGPLNDKQLEYIQYVGESGNHLLELVTDLLDVSKIDAGEIKLSYAPVSIDTVFETAKTMLKDRIDEKGLVMVTSNAQELVVSADERRLLQMLLNLLTNAIKYTPEKGSIELKATLLEDSFIKILVRDNGVGIDKDKQSSIFQEFNQVDPERDAALGGSGIGLALTRRLVELHGGAIGVKSELDKGSTFWFTLPVYRRDIASGSKPTPTVD